MTRVQALEAEIEKLTPHEFQELRSWLLEEDWSQWDEKIERDSSNGKLDSLFEAAVAEHRAGKTHEL